MEKVIFKAQPGPQTAFIQCPVSEIFFGGARGGAKTTSCLLDWLAHSARNGRNASGIFFRRTLVELQDIINRSRAIFSPLGAAWNEQKKTWEMPNGSLLRFAYLDRDADADKYQGHEYTRVYVDEVGTFPSPVPINKLRATLRSPAGIPCGIRLTGNPGGVGQQWIKKRYIDPCRTGYKIIEYEYEYEDPMSGEAKSGKAQCVFIPSRLKDNPALVANDPTYILRLKQVGSEQLVRAWIEGDWDVVEGAYFDGWDAGMHVIQAQTFLSALARLPPSRMTRFRSFDWGSAHPFSVLWLVMIDQELMLPDGKRLPRGSLVV
jgi:hypothetical protein